MKPILFFAALFFVLNACAQQDKSKRPSPPASVKETLKSGTVFEINKDVKVEGQTLPAGKYALFILPEEKEWTIIFNKKWDRWGTTYEDYKDQDILKVKVKPGKADVPTEKLAYTIDKSGKVALLWGDLKVDFKVE
jgi:hypothetical protein